MLLFFQIVRLKSFYLCGLITFLYIYVYTYMCMCALVYYIQNKDTNLHCHIVKLRSENVCQHT